jgi:transposase-like protein
MGVDGLREVLGIRRESNEDAKFWLKMIREVTLASQGHLAANPQHATLRACRTSASQGARHP